MFFSLYTNQQKHASNVYFLNVVWVIPTQLWLFVSALLQLLPTWIQIRDNVSTTRVIYSLYQWLELEVKVIIIRNLQNTRNLKNVEKVECLIH